LCLQGRGVRFPRFSFQAVPAALFFSFVKRRGHDTRGGPPAANLDLELRAVRAGRDGKISEPDAFLQIGCVAPAGNGPDGVRIHEDRIALARDASIDHFEADELALDALLLLLFESVAADEITFLELHDHFNLMTFSSKIEFYQRDFIAVSDESISQASAYLDTAKPTKSTSYTDKDMVEALQEAQKTPPTIIVLFSDGILTSGIPDPKKMREHTADNVRVFTMATEMAEDFPGAVLLRTLADGSNGEFWLLQ